MNTLTLNELRRAAEKAGRGELVMVDAEVLLELVEAVKDCAETPDEKDEKESAIYWEGYNKGWDEGRKRGLERAVELIEEGI